MSKNGRTHKGCCRVPPSLCQKNVTAVSSPCRYLSLYFIIYLMFNNGKYFRLLFELVQFLKGAFKPAQQWWECIFPSWITWPRALQVFLLHVSIMLHVFSFQLVLFTGSRWWTLTWHGRMLELKYCIKNFNQFLNLVKLMAPLL